MTIAPSRSPPVSSVAPDAAALAIDRSTRSASPAVISVPMPVSAEAGSPVLMASHLRHQRVEEVAGDRGWVITRCTEMQTWPALT